MRLTITTELQEDSGRFSQDGWWITPPVHWADEAVDRIVAPELGPDDRALVEAHLGECESCAEHLRQIRITVAVTGRIREEDLDPVARKDLMDLYRRWRRDRDG